MGKPGAMREIGMLTSYLQYKGVWDMDDLYKFVASFMHRNKFKFAEYKYIQKKPGPFGFETYHFWKGERQHDAYAKYVIDIFIHIFDEQKIPVTTKDGSSKTFSKGRMWIQFKGNVNFDYENRWDENAFFFHLRDFYHKYVIWKKILGVWWDNLYYTVFLKLQSLIKERLKMEAEGFEARYINRVR